MKPQTIHRVIDDLLSITDHAERTGDRIGYFSALYTRVTRAVADNLRNGLFEDPERMERLDVAFADLFIDAVQRRNHAHPEPRQAWRVTLEACERDDLAILQHLYLGMNVHLLVDLPLATARTCPGEASHQVEGDFRKINDVVRGQMGAFHEDLKRASPWLGRLGRFADGSWEVASRIVLFEGRRRAYQSALELAFQEPEEQRRSLDRLDREAATRAQKWIGGGFLEKLVPFKRMRAAETAEVGHIIRVLRGHA